MQPQPTATPSSEETIRGISRAFQKVCFSKTLIGGITMDSGMKGFALVNYESGQGIVISGMGLAVMQFSPQSINDLVSLGHLKRVDQPAPREVIVT